MAPSQAIHRPPRVSIAWLAEGRVDAGLSRVCLVEAAVQYVLDQGRGCLWWVAGRGRMRLPHFLVWSVGIDAVGIKQTRDEIAWIGERVLFEPDDVADFCAHLDVPLPPWF